MSYAAKSAESGREPFEWIEIAIDRCSLVYSQAPCTAPTSESGDGKCYNSWQTCPAIARPQFSPEIYWMRFCVPREVIPLDFAFADPGLSFFLPFISRVRHSPGKIDAGRSLGVRASLKVTLQDSPHHDRGIDPYVNERSYDAMDRGLMMQNLKARWPYMTGRLLRWYRGYLPASGESLAGFPSGAQIPFGESIPMASGGIPLGPSIPSGWLQSGAASYYADFERRDYVIEKFDGPDENGRVNISAKDPLRLIDDDRAQDPVPTTGVLAFDLDEAANPTDLQISVSGPADYSQYPSAVNYASINGEVFRYESTATGEIDGVPSVTLQEVSRQNLPSGYITERKDHDAGDTVQLCSLRRGRVIEVVRDLLLAVPGFDPSWIPFSDWETEYETWLAGFTIERLIVEPEGIRSLIEEIVEQTMTWGFWWCEQCNEVRYRPIRPVDIDEPVSLLTDSANLIAGKFGLAEQPEDLVNELQVYYAERDPSQDKDNVQNYGRGVVTIDTNSQSANEVGSRRSRRIYGRWHRSSAGARVQQFSARSLNQLSSTPVVISFDVTDKDDVEVAQFLDLSTIYLRTLISWSTTKRVQVTRITRGEGVLSVDAREDFYRGKFGRFAPPELEGLDYDDATDDQRARYVFLAGPDGLMSDGTPGTQLV